MSILKFPKSLIMGKNNYIESGVKILENVIIGNNNKIYNGTVIYPNTIIGNNNVILDNNILGEHPIISTEIFTEKKFNGLEIGNNNFFHISNKIYSGYSSKTIINNNNKILGESHIGHDVNIYNNVNIYSRSLIGGYVKMLDYSGMGVYSVIHQKKIIGDYAFIGMNNTITKNIFPFYININHKYSKLNRHIMNNKDILTQINDNEIIINEILLKYQDKTLNLKNYYDLIPINIYNIIENYISQTEICVNV